MIRRCLAAAALSLCLVACTGPNGHIQTADVSFMPERGCYVSPFTASYGNPELPRRVRSAQTRAVNDDFRAVRQRLRTLERDPAVEERFLRAWLKHRKNYQKIPKIISPETGVELERCRNRFYWGKAGESCFALPMDYCFTTAGDMAPNIVALNSLHVLLRRRHVQLIVMLTPDAYQIAARALAPETAPYGDMLALQCARMLLEYGIETVYTEDAVLAAAGRDELLFCYPAAIPAQATWRILAQLVSDRLKRFGDDFTVEPAPCFSERETPTVFGSNYCRPGGADGGKHQNGAVITTRETLLNGQTFRPDPHAKILVIGEHFIDWPAPGRTFAAELSKALRYPVDELALRGAAVLRNLPQILLAHPVRFLKGKRLCLLLISPRTLADVTMPDIRALDAQYRKLAGKKRVCQFPLRLETAALYRRDVAPTDIRKELKTLWQREWNKMLAAAAPRPAGTVLIREDGKPQPFAELKLPDNPAKKPFTVVVRLTTYPEQANEIIINGRTLPLQVGNAWFGQQTAALELPPDAAALNLQFSGKPGHMLIVDSVSLYQ